MSDYSGLTATPVYIVPLSETKKGGDPDGWGISGFPAIPVLGATAETISSAGASAGEVLTADGSGGASWEDAGAGFPLLAPTTGVQYSFDDENNTGMGHPEAGALYLYVQNAPRLLLIANRAILGLLEASDGDLTQVGVGFNSDPNTGLHRPASDTLANVAGGVIGSQTDAAGGAGTTRFWLYDNDDGTLKRVLVGADDSGGAGFKMLRVAN